MRTVEEIDLEINNIKHELENVHGTETEVYARIVGYYRSVKNWNKGKKEEFFIRKTFREQEPVTVTENKIMDFPESYMLFTKRSCPNCPPVKEYMESVLFPGENINVDEREGFDKAVLYGVMATPTVIFFNKDGMELRRCHSVEEIENLIA